MIETCKRSTGTPRMFFETQAEAIAYQNDPVNEAYHDDVVVFCGRCGKFHLIAPDLAGVSAVGDHRFAVTE